MALLSRRLYITIGIDMEGQKDILRMWIGEAESSKVWLGIMNELKNRGDRDILIDSIDGLNGFSEVIRAAYPMIEIQRCIVHQIRNSTKFISYKDLKSFTADLKPVYKAVTEALALH